MKNTEMPGLYMAIGMIVVYWSIVENNLHGLLVFLSKVMDHQSILKRIPRSSLEKKIQLARRCFNELPELGQYQNEANHILDGIERMKPDREKLIHSAIVKLQSTDGKFQFTKFEVEKGEHGFVSFDLNPSLLPDFGGAILALGGDMTRLSVKLIEQYPESD